MYGPQELRSQTFSSVCHGCHLLSGRNSNTTFPSFLLTCHQLPLPCPLTAQTVLGLPNGESLQGGPACLWPWST